MKAFGHLVEPSEEEFIRHQSRDYSSLYFWAGIPTI